MNEITAMKWQLERYSAILTQQIDRLYNALEELQRTTILLIELDRATDEEIEQWLQKEAFEVDADGFFQSLPLLSAFRNGKAPANALSFSWGQHLREQPDVRREMFRHRNLGPHLKHIHDRLGDIGWIYYQSALNTSLQYPFIDQCKAIPSDFDWSTYHTYVSVSPENNPQRRIRWTPPSIDYAGEGLIIAVSIPVWHNDAFIGLWSIDLPLRYLYRDFAGTKTHPDQMQFIVNREGLLLLHETLRAQIDQTLGRIFLQPLRELGGQWARLSMDTILSSNDDVLEITDGDQRQWVYCFSHMPGVEWTLFSGLPRASMEEAAAQRLQQAFEQIASGNFSHRIDSSSGNGLSTVIEAFNEMSLRLDQAEKNRNDMESRLRQAQKLEAMGQLAGGVAHDYNNINGVILGYSELALEMAARGDPLRKYFQEIFEAAGRATELTRQLLAFARCQSITPRVLDINQAVGGLIKMLTRMIGEDIELVWRPGKDIWPIEIDPTQIDRILANLCVNARDAIHNVGKIMIETTTIEWDAHYGALHQGLRPGQFVQLTVSDDGKGIDGQSLEKIFEPFFSTKSVGRGTGLGLATVYGIVKQNNGFINVYSEPGKGASFKIYFPRAGERDSVETDVSAPERIPLGHQETLLLVEDEPSFLALAEEMLTGLGYRVLAADSPKDAMDLACGQHRIDLLITDVIMPQVTGRGLANRLRAMIPGLGVLYMSGYTANVIEHRGVLDKDAILIQKPFSRRAIAHKVREVLAHAKAANFSTG